MIKTLVTFFSITCLFLFMSTSDAYARFSPSDGRFPGGRQGPGTHCNQSTGTCTSDGAAPNISRHVCDNNRLNSCDFGDPGYDSALSEAYTNTSNKTLFVTHRSVPDAGTGAQDTLCGQTVQIDVNGPGNPGPLIDWMLWQSPDCQPLVVSACEVRNSSGGVITSSNIGDTVTWHSDATGGTGIYSYDWTGDVTGTNQDETIQYTTQGTKTGNITIIDNKGNSGSDSCSLTVSGSGPQIDSLHSDNSNASQTNINGPYKYSGRLQAEGGQNWLNPINVTLNVTAGSNPIREYYMAFYDKSISPGSPLSEGNFLNTLRSQLGSDPSKGVLLAYGEPNVIVGSGGSTPVWYVWKTNSFVPLNPLTRVRVPTDTSPVFEAFSIPPATSSQVKWKVLFYAAFGDKSMWTGALVKDQFLSAYSGELAPTPLP